MRPEQSKSVSQIPGDNGQHPLLRCLNVIAAEIAGHPAHCQRAALSHRPQHHQWETVQLHRAPSCLYTAFFFLRWTHRLKFLSRRNQNIPSLWSEDLCVKCLDFCARLKGEKKHAKWKTTKRARKRKINNEIDDFHPQSLTWFTTSILAAHSLIRGSEGWREGGVSPGTAQGRKTPGKKS